jgi:hypothetical protein
MSPSSRGVLEYRREEPRGGCGPLALQTLGGFILALFAFLTVRTIAHAAGPALGLALAITLFVGALLVLSFVAATGRPGLLIGFIIASAPLVMINVLCGRFI